MPDQQVPVALRCPSCGAALVFQPGYRECRCRYCQTMVALPASAGPIYRAPPPPSALNTAIGRNDVERLRALLEAGADPNGTVQEMGSPRSLLFNAIGVACFYQRKEAALLLLEYGADPHVTQGPAGMTMIHTAAIAGVPEIVTGLLDRGASVGARDGWGQTPLHCATRSGEPSMMELLLRAGADINARDNRGRTPLDIAREHGNKPFIAALKKCGARGGHRW